MKNDVFSDLSDSEIVQYFRDAALERAKCGFNWRAGNRVLENKLAPAYEALAARGPAPVHKLLQLTKDENARVRLEAAVFAYDIASAVSRTTLQERPVGIQALIMLLHKDGEFSAEFDRLAKLGREQLHEELARRFGGYLEE